MWYPPSMLVPVYRPADVPAAVMWPVVPFHQRSNLTFNDIIDHHEHHLSVADERRFLLHKSVYDLVKVSHFLEFSDKKLLGWYLSLTAEDRKLIQDEGGLLYFLHRHPALEVFRHIVHLKQNLHPCPDLDMSSVLDGSRWAAFYYISQCVNCGISSPGGAKKCCRCSQTNPEENVGICEDEKTLQLLPNNVRAELNLLIAKGHASEDMSLRSPQQFDCMQSISDHLSASQSNSVQQTQQPRKNSSNVRLVCQMWEERKQGDEKDLGVFKDPSAQASFSLDGELEMQGTSKSSDHGEGPRLPGASVDFPHPQEKMQYDRLGGTIMGHTSSQWSDVTNTSMTATKGSSDVSTTDEPVTCGAEICTFPDSVSCISNSSEWTDLTEDLQTLSSEEDLEYQTKTDEFHSLDDEASSSPDGIMCFNPSRSTSGQCTPEQEFTRETYISSVSQNMLNGKPPTACEVCPVRLSTSHAVDASNDFRACFTSNRSTEITQDLFVKHCQNVSTDTDSCAVNQKTQTLLTSEKCIITEVFMSDLDAVCEEFGKLRMMTEELMHLKDEMARSGPGSVGGPRSEPHESHCGCGAVQRARWAELRLLTLQFAMCQQHCWRWFYTSQGEATLQGTKVLPDEMSQTLKSLEDGYVEMKKKILEGVPLDNMKPLSVDINKLTAPTCYKPSLIYEAFLDDYLPKSSFKTNSLEGDCQTNHDVLKISITDRGNVTGSQSYAEHDSAPSSETANNTRRRCMPGSSQQPGVSSDAKPDASKDLNIGDDWFDAEEELGYESQSCKEDQKTGQSDGRDSKKEQRVEANRKEDQCVMLCVSDLANSVTECDLSINQVSLCNSTNTRVAIESDAEATVRDMNGQSIEGHTIHEEHVHKSPKDGQTAIKKSCVQLSQKSRSSGKEQIMLSTNNSNLLRCSLDKLTNICTTPTATGTCVPQHYGTMGSFDTIMTQVSERHPKMGRQKIVRALLELREKHYGVLSGLPLGEIVDMTSELLSHSTCT